MKTGMTIGAPLVVVLVILAVLLGGCKDTDLLAPSGGTIQLTANPQTIVFDSGLDYGLTTLTAQVFDENSQPQENVIVTFATEAGVLASGGTPITTNANGFARDTLRVSASDPASITVTAQSGTVSKTVDVSVPCPGNDSPVAEAGSPPGSAVADTDITLNGSATDTETPSAELTFVWNCGTGGTTGDPNSATVICRYSTADPKTATLTVTDDGRATAGGAPNSRCELSDSDTVTFTVTAAP